MTITEFLEARIAEDEAVAREPRGRNWTADSFYTIASENDQCVLDIGHDGQYDWEGNVIAHIARHDPARVLAECAAKRGIVEAATSWDHEINPSAYYACRAYKLKEGTWKVLKISEGKCNCGVTQQRNAILKPLAAVYSSHPDYRQEWVL